MRGLLCLLIGMGVTLSTFGQEAPVLRLLTYNIHHAEGLDGKVDYDRIARVIRETKADLVALQEVDIHTQRTDRVDQARTIASKLGMHQVFGRAIHFQGGQYGLAVLSRWPILTHKVHALPYRINQEPRIALETHIRPDKGIPELCFIDTHLCHLSETTRSEQVQRLLQIVPKNGPAEVILAGDFNARPDSSPMERLWGEGWRDLLGEHHGIDYLLAPGASHWEVRSARIVDAPVASDHMPVFVELEWKQ